MAGSHRAAKNARSARRRTAHSAKPQRQPYRWLGAGAVAVGLGVAMANGTAVSYAEDTDGGSAPSSDSATHSPDAAHPPRSASVEPTDRRTNGTAGESAVGDAKNPAGSEHPHDNTSDIEDEAEAEELSGSAPTDLDEDGEDAKPSAEPAVTLDDSESAAPQQVSPAPSTDAGTAKASASTSTSGSEAEAEAPTVPEDGGTAATPLSMAAAAVSTDQIAPPSVHAATMAALAAPAPVTLHSIVADVLTWIGLGPAAAVLPVPALPVPTFIEALWIAVRQNVYSWNNQRPVASVSISGQDLLNGVITGKIVADDYEGDPITYIVTTEPGHGTVVVDADGNFTYTPDPAYAASGGTDLFVVTVDDRIGNPHTYGLLGALGLLGPTTVAVNLSVTPVVPANLAPTVGTPPYDYTVDTDTGVITGTINVTDPEGDALTYYVVTPPESALGSFELDELTGAWTFTPYPRTRVLAALLSQAPGRTPLAVTFSVSATDGVNTTEPIMVSENIIGAATAPVPLPEGTAPLLSAVDPNTGDAYILVLTNLYGDTTDPQTSYLAAIVHSDGSFTSVPAGNAIPEAAIRAYVVGDTIYVVTQTIDSDGVGRSSLSTLGSDGLTPVAGPVSGTVQGDPIVIGDTIYLLAESGSYETGYHTEVIGVGPDGVTSTGPISGAYYRDPIVIGDTTYLVFHSGTYDTEYHTEVIGVGPDGVTSTGPISGEHQRDPIVIGDTTYLVTRSGNYDTGYQTRLISLGPDGVAATDPTPGNLQRDPITVGGTTYLLIQSETADSGDQLRVITLTPDGASAPTDPIPGYVYDDPILVGDVIYLTTLSGTSATGYETHLIGLGPDGLLSSPIPMPGYSFGEPLTVGDTTYLLTTTESGFQTHVMALTPDSATPAGSIPGVVMGDPITIGGITYVISRSGEEAPATWTTYLTALNSGAMPMVPTDYQHGYAPSPWSVVVDDTTYLVSFTYTEADGYLVQLMGVQAAGLTPVGNAIQSYSAYEPIVIDGTTYLVTTQYNSTGSYTHLWSVGPGSLTPVGTSIRHEVNQLTHLESAVFGDTTYLVAETYDASSGYQTSLLAVGPAGLTPIGSPAPGRQVDTPLEIGGTAYLVTQTGDETSGYQTHLTAVSPGAVAAPTVTIPGSVTGTFTGVPRTLTVGDTVYLVSEQRDGQYFTTYLTAVGADGVTAAGDPIPGLVSRDPVEVNGVMLLVITPYQRDGGSTSSFGESRVVALTPSSGGYIPLPGRELDAFRHPIVVGGTAYFITADYQVTEGGWSEPYQAHITLLDPGQITQLGDPIPWGYQQMVALGDSTYVLSAVGDDPSTFQTSVIRLTSDGSAITDSFPGIVLLSDGVLLIGDTTYVMTSEGLWAVDVDVDGSNRDL